MENIQKLLDDIINDNNSDAKSAFDAIVASKATEAIELRKKEVANNLFNKEEETAQ